MKINKLYSHFTLYIYTQRELRILCLNYLHRRFTNLYNAFRYVIDMFGPMEYI